MLYNENMFEFVCRFFGGMEINMKKISVFLVLALLCAQSAYAAQFNDINGHWAETVINELADKGIVNGTDTGAFMPNGTVTRAEYLKMIMNTVKIAPSESGAADCLDAKGTDWYVGYLKSALEKGLIPQNMIRNYDAEIITDTDSDGNVVSSRVEYSGAFDGTNPISREEMAFLTMGMYQYVLNANTMKGLAEKTDLSFTDDSEISEWAKSGVRLAAANGFINGMEDGSFQPKSTATRAQAAAVISRVIEKVK